MAKKYEDQMDIFEEGGLKDEGGSVDPVSGNDVPSGSTQKEVRDDIPAQLSEGEFVLPADVVRYIGLENIMKMRDMAKEGLAKMEDMGQMGNSEEATISDTTDFDDDIDKFIDELDQEEDDNRQEFQVGGLAGMTPQTPGVQTPATGFLPPGVTVPGTDTTLPEAPVVTPGGSGPVPGMPTYETKQYIGPNGEIRSFTFINGEPVVPIPEGFKEYDPTTVPETQTGVPTAQVTGDGGDGRETETESAKVDPVSGIAKSYAEQNPESEVATTVKSLQDLNDKYNKSLALSIGSLLMGGGITAIGGAIYGSYKYNQEANKLNEQLNAQLMEALGPAAENIITDAGQLSGQRFTEEAVEKTYTDAVKAGASPALASALATTTSRAFSEIPEDADLESFEMQTADIFRDVTGGSLDAGSAQTAMLSEQDFGLFDTEADRAAFYGADYDSISRSTPSTERTVNGVPVSDFSTQRGAVDTLSGSYTTRGVPSQTVSQSFAAPSATIGRPSAGLTSLSDLGGTSTFTGSRGVDPNIGPAGQRSFSTGPVAGQYSMDTLTASLGTPTVSRPSVQRTTAQSIAETERQAQEVSSGGRDVGGSDFGSQGEADAVASDGWGSDAHFDAIDDQFDANESTSGGGGGDAGGGSYCCTKMVDHELWKTRREFALMHKWHREQPQWWRDGYDVWGNVIAETLLKKNSPFWTSVMQSFYDHHVKKKKHTLKSLLANAIIYPGVITFGYIAKITGRHVNAVQR